MEARRLLCTAVAALVVARLVRGIGTSEDQPFKASAPGLTGHSQEWSRISGRRKMRSAVGTFEIEVTIDDPSAYVKRRKYTLWRVHLSRQTV
jgi:hypothetical protein